MVGRMGFAFRGYSDVPDLVSSKNRGCSLYSVACFWLQVTEKLRSGHLTERLFIVYLIRHLEEGGSRPC